MITIMIIFYNGHSTNVPATGCFFSFLKLSAALCCSVQVGFYFLAEEDEMKMMIFISIFFEEGQDLDDNDYRNRFIIIIITILQF